MQILYIGSRPRSGSTLLGNILNEIPGYFHIGEVLYIWENGFANNRLCGCGTPFQDCSVWKEVSSKAFGGVGAVDPSRMAALRDNTPDNRHIPWQLLQELTNSPRALPNSPYLPVLRSLYRSIQETTDCDVIVDSSKTPAHAYLLAQLPSVDFTLLHLIRDPRGTAYSWQKKVARDDVDQDDDVFMPQRSPSLQSSRWVFWNLLYEGLGLLDGVDYSRVRYEDFVSSPIQHLASSLPVPSTEEQIFTGENTIHLGENHTAWGNPSRMKDGTVTLRLDDEWRQQLSPMDRLKVEAVAGPLLPRYGYSLR